jgi:hypothetical protein
VCKQGDQWGSCCRFLGTGCLEVFDAELLVIVHALVVMIEKRQSLHMNARTIVAMFDDSQTAIRQVAR